MRMVQACPACSFPESQQVIHVVTKEITAQDQLVYKQCNNCGLIFAGHRFDDSAETNELYDKPYQNMDREQFLSVTRFKTEVNNYRKKWLERTLRKLDWTAKSKRALDIGCNDGSFLRLLKDDGWSVVGIDPNTVYARYAREIHGVEIYNGYFEYETFPRASFDLVTSFQMIEHVQNPTVLLFAIREVLGTSGLLFLETPNLRYIQQRHLIRPHVILYAKDTLTQILEHSGFEVLVLSENGPGMMTFDQLTALARPTQREASPWRRGTTFEDAKTWLDYALRSSFPSPSRPTMKNRLFRTAQRTLGEARADTLKAFYRKAQSGLRIRNLARTPPTNDGLPDIANLPEPIRQAFMYRDINEGHLREISRLSDEFMQLKVLCRIRAFGLSPDGTRRLVDAELKLQEVSPTL